MQEDSMAFSDASQYCAMQDYIMSRGALHHPRLAAASLSSICLASVTPFTRTAERVA